ncbi:hypothetical protein VPHD292_0030 [Vibrio phage D292]
MFKIEVIQKVNIPTISEADLKKILTKAITAELPAGVVINDMDFKVTRKGGQEVTLEVDAQFAESTPFVAPAAEPVAEKSEPITLPEADDVVQPEETTQMSRDGVPAAEKTELDLIDEVLAEEEEALAEEAKADESEPETKPSTEGKSLAELFNS